MSDNDAIAPKPDRPAATHSRHSTSRLSWAMPGENEIQSSDPFLTAALDAFRRRRRALKNKTRSVSVERFIVERDGDNSERLEIECRASGKRTVRLFLWSERLLWIDAREPVKNAGWAWTFTDEGRLLGTYDAHAVIDALERTLALTYELTAADVPRLAAIWKPMLAKGPQAIDVR
jgi:hypothetical protein